MCFFILMLGRAITHVKSNREGQYDKNGHLINFPQCAISSIAQTQAAPTGRFFLFDK
jgi:hypothetical protein